MATGSSEATSPDTEFGIKDISALHEALCPVSAKYKFFGLQIGVDINEIKKIEADYKDSSDCLLEILFLRLNQETALTCADICKALRSEVVNMCQLANSFPSCLCQSIDNETKRESGKKKKAEKVSKSVIPLRMNEKESEYESESENIQKAVKSAEVERQVHERDEPKSKWANERACGKGKTTRLLDKPPELNKYKEDRKKAKHKEISKTAGSPQTGARPDQNRTKSVKVSEKSQPEATTQESDSASSFASKEKGVKSEKMGRARDHSELKHHQSESVSNRQVRNKATEKKDSATKLQRKLESQADSENEESDSGNDSSEDGEDSERKSSDEEYYTAVSDFEEENIIPHKRKEAKKDERKLKKKVNKSVVESSKYESFTRKVKGKRESEAASLKYDSPGDYEQSDPGHGSRDQEEHDIQQKRRKKKKQRRESSMSPTAIGSSSPSTSQEEKKKQPVSKKQGHRKKHVRKMKEKRERMKRGKEKKAHSSGTDDSSPEWDMTNNKYEGEMKELVNVFERFFGKLCCAVFDPKDIAAELLRVGLISKSVMRDMMLSPESQQAKIIALVDELDKKTKSCPYCLFDIIEVMLENEALQETAREILRETGARFLVCELHFFKTAKLCSLQVECVLLKLLPNSPLKYLPLTLQSHQLLIPFHQWLKVC